MSSPLHAQESKIRFTVLKHTQQPHLPFWQKQLEFSETCLAIKNIIKNKLYRQHGTNLEKYFLTKFNVSRAQVYRFLDCAHVLETLQGLNPIPHKYRICKELKKKAGIGPHCRVLWEMVIERGVTENEIEHFDFNRLPKLLDILETARLSAQSSPNFTLSSINQTNSKESTATSSLNTSPYLSAKQLFNDDLLNTTHSTPWASPNLRSEMTPVANPLVNAGCDRFDSFVEICTEEMETEIEPQFPAISSNAHTSTLPTDWDVFKQTITFLAEAGYQLKRTTNCVQRCGFKQDKGSLDALLVAAKSLDNFEE